MNADVNDLNNALLKSVFLNPPSEDRETLFGSALRFGDRNATFFAALSLVLSKVPQRSLL
jgi:hypothetical protein